MGLDPDRFWRITPRQVAASMEARERAMIREHNDRAWLAWHTAVLTRNQKITPLRTLLVRPKKVSWQDQLEGLKAWVVASGGKIVTRSKEQ